MVEYVDIMKFKRARGLIFLCKPLMGAAVVKEALQRHISRTLTHTVHSNTSAKTITTYKCIIEKINLFKHRAYVISIM